MISAATAQQLADYFAWQVEIGRGACEVRLDPRGLSYVKPDHNRINIVIPPDGETCDLARGLVFVSARF